MCSFHMEEVSQQHKIKKKSNTQEVIKERDGERAREQAKIREREKERERVLCVLVTALKFLMPVISEI